MQFIIAVFTSRNETLYFANLFRNNRIYVDIINTPKEAGQACGISVKFDERLLPIAKNLIRTRPFKAFYGFFRVTNIGNNRKVERL